MNRITSPIGLIGETVRMAIEPREGVFVMVFESNNWAVIEADWDGEYAYVTMREWGSDDVNDYLNADQLLAADLVNQPQYELLKQKEAEDLRVRNAKRVAILRDELQRLESTDDC